MRPKNEKIKQKQYFYKLNKDFKNGPHEKIFVKKKKSKWLRTGLQISNQAGHVVTLGKACAIVPLLDNLNRCQNLDDICPTYCYHNAHNFIN